MARFCKFCGSPIREDARFCKTCGKQLTRTAAQQPSHIAPQREQPAYRVPAQNTASQTTRQRAAQTPPRTASARQAAAQAQAASQKLGNVLSIHAGSAAGEINCGELALSGLGGVTEQVTKVLSPVSGLLRSVGSFLGGIKGVFQKPSALIGTVLTAALWFVLARLRGSDSGLVKALSWLTFSEGGFDRSALGAVGGVLGKGVGKGTARHSLSMAFSDFIFAAIVEETGLVGGLFIILLYLIFLFRCISLSFKCPDAFSQALVLGLAFLITTQAFLHILVNVRLIPITGHTLPLISHGGTAYLVLSGAVGIILSVSRTIDKQIEEQKRVELTDEDELQEPAGQMRPGNDIQTDDYEQDNN